MADIEEFDPHLREQLESHEMYLRTILSSLCDRGLSIGYRGEASQPLFAIVAAPDDVAFLFTALQAWVRVTGRALDDHEVGRLVEALRWMATGMQQGR